MSHLDNLQGNPNLNLEPQPDQPMMPDAPQAPAPQQQLAPQSMGSMPQAPVQQQPVQAPIPEPVEAPVSEPVTPQQQTIQNAQPMRDGNEPKLDVAAMTGKVKDFTTNVTSKMGNDAQIDRIMMIALYVCGGILAIGPFLTSIIFKFGGRKEALNFVLPEGAGIGDGAFIAVAGALFLFFVFKKIRMGQVISSGIALLIWLYSNYNINAKIGDLGSAFGLTVSKSIMYPILFLAALVGFGISLVYLLKERKAQK